MSNEERLRERVIRARDAKAGPFAPALSGGEIVEMKPDMSDAEYAALIERGEQQQVSPEDERRLRAKVGRIRP